MMGTRCWGMGGETVMKLHDFRLDAASMKTMNDVNK